ncbi:MAG TPA: Nif3-like dinuclear metal center hexameric protein [Ignavibacteriaceae bacterium]|nr:Nif3-like dinuclear metal center hexameric protein [Ignavibacteriaceae bacterium]
MKCIELLKYLEHWAPKEIAWERDNAGLQVGSLEREIKNVLLCLDITPPVVDEAVKKSCNLIISHHPLLFHSLKKISTDKDYRSRVIEKLLKNEITLYSAHTNLDFTKDGVSFRLAKKLKLENIDFLKKLKSNQVKLTVFVPEESVGKVSESIFNADGGIIGEYSNCSFRTGGKGTFMGSENTNPAAGTKERFETVDEVRLEVLVDSWKVDEVLSTMLKVHPYEEPAYDIYPLQNENSRYGEGAIGTLPAEMKPDDFLNYVCDNLNIKNIRFTDGHKGRIKTIAVCGGAGSELLSEVLKSEADAFITADIKYHTFQEAEGQILLIDAGHYETEIFSLNEIEERLNSFSAKGIKVFKYNKSTNPVKYFNNKKENG